MKCPSCFAAISPEAVACPRCGILVQGRIASESKKESKTWGKSKKWRIGGALGVIGTLVLEFLFRHAIWTGILVFSQHWAILRSPGYQIGLEFAKSAPELRQILGEPIEDAGFALGELRRAPDTEFTAWWVRLKGPKGSGYLYGVANHIGNTWDYSRLAFVPANGSGRVDLTAPPRQDPLKFAHAVRRVYLVPLDTAAAQAVAWAPKYYKLRLDLDVTILPIVPLDSTVTNTNRKQIVAEKALDAMRRAEPELAADPSAVLIGITSQDMYIRSFNWDYSVNLRLRRLAVISTARLQPFSDLTRSDRGLLFILLLRNWNKELVGSRLQKLLSKNIYIECFDLPLSDDFTSLVANGAQTGTDVDWMGSEIMGVRGRWYSSVSIGNPFVSVVADAGKPPIWRFDEAVDPPDTASQSLASDLRLGLFVRRKTDFVLKGGDGPTFFSRAYRNRSDQFRSLGIGTSNTLDTFIVGKMNSYIELIYTNGSRIHFDRDRSVPDKQFYLPRENEGEGGFASAIFDQGTWRVTTKDGWSFFFPYRPKAYAYQVSVLTGFTNPKGEHFEMLRDEAGDLLSLNTPWDSRSASSMTCNIGLLVLMVLPVELSTMNTIPPEDSAEF